MVDWPSYNESLVRRGQVLLDFDVLDGWDHELSQMNLGKVGEPYCYPDSFIELLGYMRAYFHLPYRQTQGVVIAHATLPSFEVRLLSYYRHIPSMTVS